MKLKTQRNLKNLFSNIFQIIFPQNDKGGSDVSKLFIIIVNFLNVITVQPQCKKGSVTHGIYIFGIS